MQKITFTYNDIAIDVNFSTEENTVWMSQKDMAALFERSKMNISLHIKNILEKFGSNPSVVKREFTTQSDGKTYNINHYNLDIIKEVGYKINPSLTEYFINWCKEELEKDKYQLLPIQSNIIRFEEDNVVLDVRVSPQQYTVWLSLNQMSILFDRDKTVISGHIADIYKEKELEENRTTAKNATVQIEGKRTVTRTITYYNLDVIISVGFRVTSNRGIVFRRWAIKTLSQYMIKGYSTDERRIALLELPLLPRRLLCYRGVPISGRQSIRGLKRLTYRRVLFPKRIRSMLKIRPSWNQRPKTSWWISIAKLINTHLTWRRFPLI